jgi:hypothetical protein
MSRLSASLLALVALVALQAAREAQAGCGCDHPPPALTQIMPPFAWAGRNVRIFADTDAFTPGTSYDIDVAGKHVIVVASEPESVSIVMPIGVAPGPVEIHVKGPGVDHKYTKDLFTALPKPVRLPSHPGAFAVHHLKSAIAVDGTLFLPLDLSDVLDPTQFAFGIGNLLLDFGHDDVILFNADAVDLRAFTLELQDPTRRQWGSYYGWQVRDDGSLGGLVYEPKVKKSRTKQVESDVLTYWRHEFHTYAAAHGPGGTHQVDARGFHPDGTFHVDHDHLVIAIRGFVTPADFDDKLADVESAYETGRAQIEARAVEDGAHAGNDLRKLAQIEADRIDHLASKEREYQSGRAKVLATAKHLGGGNKDLDVKLLALRSDHPIEPDEIVTDSSFSEEELAPTP